MLSVDDLRQLELFGQCYAQVEVEFPDVAERLKINETVRHMINFLIIDVVEETGRRIRELNITSFADVRAAKIPLVAFSPAARKKNGELKKFLYKNMYRHYRVARMANKAERVIREIFATYMQNPAMLPQHQQQEMSTARTSDSLNQERLARIIADYIAGMTDRYALEEYERLFNITARP